MGVVYKLTQNYLDKVDPDSAFVEIGSDRLEGSTTYFANLAKEHNVLLHSVDIEDEPQNRIQHDNVIWHTHLGSDWCKNVWPNEIKKSISVLYLDNFDYHWIAGDIVPDNWNEKIYANIRGDSWPEQFVEFKKLPMDIQLEVKTKFNVSDELLIENYFEKLYKKHNLTFNNNECQIEHFKQIYYLYPWLHEDCLVIFDDTHTFNDCWIGKNGPGVIFLQAMGFKILAQEVTDTSKGVVMQRKL